MRPCSSDSRLSAGRASGRRKSGVQSAGVVFGAKRDSATRNQQQQSSVTVADSLRITLAHQSQLDKIFQYCCRSWCFGVWAPLQVQTLVRDGDRVTAVSSSSSQPSQHGQQQQQFPADVVVLAAGVGTAELCQQLGYRLPLLHKPAAVLLTSPLQPGTLQHMVVTDTVFILQVCCCLAAAAALLPAARLACK